MHMTPLKPKKGSKTKWTSEKTKIKDYVQRKNKGIRKTSKKKMDFYILTESRLRYKESTD